jgi:hypothetical protein
VMPWRMIEISQTIFSDARRSIGAAISLPRLASASSGVKCFPSYSTIVDSAAAEPRSRKRRR